MASRFRLRRGFTLIELLTVIGIIAVLAAILFPVFGRARSKARQTRCLSNMQQIGQAIELYVQDNAGRLVPWSITHGGTDPWSPPPADRRNSPHPTVSTWDVSIMSYLRNEELLICTDNPNENWKQARAYAVAQYTQVPMTIRGQQIALGGFKDDIPEPTRTVMLFEKGNNLPGAWGDALGQNVYQSHNAEGQSGYHEKPFHGNGKNFLFVSGHAKFYPKGAGPFDHEPARADAKKGDCKEWGKPPHGDWPMGGDDDNDDD